MIDLDHEKMFTFLKVPWAKKLDTVLAVSKRKLTSVKQELGSTFGVKDAYQALIDGFKTALNIELVESELTGYEQNLVEKIKKERFGSEEWNLFGKVSV